MPGRSALRSSVRGHPLRLRHLPLQPQQGARRTSRLFQCRTSAVLAVADRAQSIAADARLARCRAPLTPLPNARLYSANDAARMAFVLSRSVGSAWHRRLRQNAVRPAADCNDRVEVHPGSDVTTVGATTLIVVVASSGARPSSTVTVIGTGPTRIRRWSAGDTVGRAGDRPGVGAPLIGQRVAVDPRVSGYRRRLAGPLLCTDRTSPSQSAGRSLARRRWWWR